MLTFLNPKLWLIGLILVVSSFSFGWYKGSSYAEHKYQVQAIESANLAQKNEDERLVIQAKKDLETVQQLQQLKEKSNVLQRQLEKSKAALSQCTLDGNTLGVLNNASKPSKAAGDTSTPSNPSEAATAPLNESKSCYDLAQSAVKNYTEVCNANALQLKELQDWYNLLKTQRNKGLE